MLRRVALLLGLLLAATPLSAVDRVEVLVLFRDRAVVMLDGERRLLEKGVASPEGVVLISATSREAVLEIDGVQSTWGLSRRINRHFESRRPLRALIAPDEQGHYIVAGYINGLPATLLVDTGATLVAMNRILARRLGIDYRVRGERSMAKTASGLAAIYLVQLKSVRVGEIELKNVDASVHDSEFPGIALLGMSFLGRLDMQREGAVLELKTR